jgi:ribonuclease P protein subunit POP4
LKINRKNIIYHEIIGLNVCILKHLDPNLEGKCGKVYYETKNTLVLETDKGKKIVMKKGAIFEFLIENEKITVLGDDLIGRPEDRVKNLIK